MKYKGMLFSVIGLSIAVLLISLWLTKHPSSQAYICDLRQSDVCGGNCDNSCGQENCILKSACSDLPDPYVLLSRHAELNLSSGQFAVLCQLNTVMRRDKIKQYDIQRLELELKELLRRQDLDKEILNAKLEEIGKLRTEIAKNCVDTKIDAREVLTDEQLQKLESVDKKCFVKQHIFCRKNT